MLPEVKYFIKMLIFKTNVLNGNPFYRGTVIYNKPPANARMSAYCGYVSTSARRAEIDNIRKTCVYYSPGSANLKPFDLREVATAMKIIISTINNCENDRARFSGHRIVLGNADAPHFV